LLDFLTPERDMRLSATSLARNKETILHGTFKKNLRFRYVGFESAFGALRHGIS
jgi:hypothetical protein